MRDMRMSMNNTRMSMSGINRQMNEERTASRMITNCTSRKYHR